MTIHRMMPTLAVGLGVALFWLASVLSVFPHDAMPTAAEPEGWKYPFSCCSGYDCRSISAASVKGGPQGYTVPSGELVIYSDVRIKPSPDPNYHWCTVAGASDGRTICLFVPGPGV